MPEFSQYFWHDSTIEKIELTSEQLIISVRFDDDTSAEIICRRVAGVDHLCMWEDDTIANAQIREVSDFNTPFLREIASGHPVYQNPENNPVREGLLDLSIELTNNITFHVYCYEIQLT